MFEEYQIVRLRRNIPEFNLPEGVLGTILLGYDPKPNQSRAYEVEFVDSQGTTIAQITVFQEDIEIVKELDK